MVQYQDDQAWLRGLKSGDPEAFEAFVDRYEPMIHTCCRRVGLTDDQLEDVVAETYLTVYQGLARYQAQAALSSWVWTIAYRQAVNYLRRNTRHHRNRSEWEPEDLCSDLPRPGARLEELETEQDLRRAIDDLPETWARILHLFYWQAESTVQIARTLDIGVGAVRACLFRARNRLRQVLVPSYGRSGLEG